MIHVPGGDDLTQNGQRMGPAHFVAYELISDPANADGGPVDVYELAKTLWALATGLQRPPEGHQPANSAQFRIADYVAQPKAADLDRLEDRATLLQPTARPTMREVMEELAAWQQREVTQVEVDLAEQRAILQAKLAPELAQLNLKEKRKDEALAAIRSLAVALQAADRPVARSVPQPGGRWLRQDERDAAHARPRPLGSEARAPENDDLRWPHRDGGSAPPVDVMGPSAAGSWRPTRR